MRPFTTGGRPHLGLLGKFAIASLIPIVLLAVVLAQFLQGAIRDRALVNARQSASLLERSLIEPELAQASLSKPLPASEVARLDRRLQPSLDGNPIASIKVWNRNGLVIYASDRAIIGKRFAPSDELREALEGSTASEVSDLTAAENATDRRFGKLLEVYTPLQRGNGAPVEGAFELYLPYLPIQAAISHDTRRVSVILLAGVALLYLVLYPDRRQRLHSPPPSSDRERAPGPVRRTHEPPEPHPLPGPREPGDPHHATGYRERSG